MEEKSSINQNKESTQKSSTTNQSIVALLHHHHAYDDDQDILLFVSNDKNKILLYILKNEYFRNLKLRKQDENIYVTDIKTSAYKEMYNKYIKNKESIDFDTFPRKEWDDARWDFLKLKDESSSDFEAYEYKLKYVHTI